MASAWRLVAERYAEKAFSGEGAARFGGRFNNPGHEVVYTGDSLALCLVEVMVHLDEYRQLQGRVFFRIAFDEDLVEVVSENDLPEGWEEPFSVVARSIGDRWLEERRAAVLRVPSAVVPDSCNYLFNPAHPDFMQIEIEEPQPFPVDRRLLRGTS